MKTRQGFVSNSSSSSFIVAFPKRPKTAQECHDMMFPEGVEPVEIYDNRTTTEEISETVFRDIQDQQAQTCKQIADQFQSRYHYLTSGYRNIDPENLDLSEFQDSIDEICWGTDEEILKELISYTISRQERKKKLKEIRDQILADAGIEFKGYFFMTEEEREEYNTFCRTNEEYKEADRATWRRDWEEEHRLNRRMATADAKAFIQLTRGQPKYHFDYGDDDGPYYSILEHAGIFENLPHVRISHH